MRLTPLLISACLFCAPLVIGGCIPGSGSDVPERSALIEAESQRLNDWFAARYQEELARSPMSQTFLGMKEHQDKLDDISQIAIDEEATLKQNWVDEMRREFDIDRLDEQTRLSYRLFEAQAESDLATHAVSQNDYVFTHMFGPHTGLPSFLINYQSVASVEDARAYISRQVRNMTPAYLCRNSFMRI